MAEAAKLKNLIKSRGTLKARQTCFKKYLEEVKRANIDKEINNYDQILILEIEGRIERHFKVLNDFDTIQGEIENLADDIETEVEEREEFEGTCLQLLASAKSIVNYYYSSQKQTREIDAISVRSENSIYRDIKLPDIQLPRYGGDYGSFLEFRDLFDSLINSDKTLADIQKFHYLRSAVFGGAAQVIRSIEFTGDNYQLAWKTLCNRYYNCATLVDNHVKALFDLPILQTESSNELRKMLDNISKHLQSLEKLKQPVKYWDTLLLHIFSSKLDRKTAREWEEKRAKTREIGESTSGGPSGEKFLSFSDFKEFIQRKADLIERLESKNIRDKKPMTETNYNKLKGKSDNTSQSLVVASTSSCLLCKGDHTIHNCPDFMRLNVDERVEKVKQLRLCFNCLKGSHPVRMCKSSLCRRCRGHHHTLIHFEKTDRVNSSNDNTSEQCVRESQVSVTAENSPRSQVLSSGVYSNNCYVLLQTAMVNILDSNGVPRMCRALLDGASQSNLITQRCAEFLGLQKHESPLAISGVGESVSYLRECCEVKVQSCVNAFELSLSCVVIPSICAKQPSGEINISSWNIPKNLILADPTFCNPGDIDILIGAGVYLSLLCIGQVQLGSKMPTLQKTRFGWVFGGIYRSSDVLSFSSCHLTTNLDVQEQLARFWEIEEPYNSKRSYSSQETECKEIFDKTTKRDSNGKFVVTIPFKQPISLLGESRQRALNRFRSLETKLLKNQTLKDLYCSFMREYISLGHMSRVQNPEKANVSYYFPHHGILNEKNQTTKLRVVFDASAQSDTGVSLNDIQHIGPTIQEDLISILLRFRQYNVVICADIVKMYRQIWIHPDQWCLQRILWRFSPTEAIEEYELKTVTYGNASSPFLAVRCLQQLSKESEQSHPNASRVIARDFYMDDVISGTDNIEEAITLCDDLRKVLLSGGFELQKWASNRSEVLQHVKQGDAGAIMKMGDHDLTKTLGLYWASSEDVLLYTILEPSSQRVTKRSILSDVSLIFDPLGLLAPTIIHAKIILQKLWMYKLSWDESVPLEIDTKWRNFRNKLVELNTLRIPRRICCDKSIHTEIHGFCDASLEAYGACVYIRSVNKQGDIQVRLLTAKSKVAPLKTITIPKLELCGALVLAQLIKKVKCSMTLRVDEYFLWCDSTVCLSWIKTQPNILQTFVSNRVSQIQGFTEPSDWNFIRTNENPADLLSRGVMPNLLRESNFWWEGPNWLSKSSEVWPVCEFQIETKLPECKKQATVLKIEEVQCFPISSFSSLTRLKRITAYCLRFLYNLKNKVRRGGPLKAKDLENSMHVLIKISQKECFENEIEGLKRERNLHTKSNLLHLNPFLDSAGILRVGGRLESSQFPYEKKHPVLLSGTHHLTKLIFRAEHLRLLHAGPQMLLSSIREIYWPLKGRVLARNTVFKCIRCFRSKPKQVTPIMGMLPKERVTCAAPFKITGVDYAGPFNIKDRKGRGSKTSKCYIALFVCFVTKCVHLELVSDLTTEAFLAAFRRFISRRSSPSHMYSDNGRTFVGVKNELLELGKFLQNNNKTISELSANENIQWHFIPAFSPHMGGLWEAGVRSCKGHLKRVLGNALVTFEEMCTVLTQIEAILNSRPLTPLSSDPNDLSVLTPSHFLIGKSLTAIPGADYQEIAENRLSRFQLLQKLQQHFWTRWKREYISQLQSRVKWKTQQAKVQINDLVVIRNDNAPPLQWELGRIVDLHPGTDNIVRVVSIKTQRGILKRAVANICVLPIDSDAIKSSDVFPLIS